VDDATRLAYSEVLPAETGPSAAGFLRRAAVWFGTLGVRIGTASVDGLRHIDILRHMCML
jgi:hypothetical protein